jgi:lipopolysaccharide/colanic/teichoic acid biosynthesis glycosyltransferase
MIALHLRLRMIAYSQSALKRLFDLAVSFAVLPIALPAMVFGAILVVLTTGGTFIYRQRRVGRNNREFTIYKLRTLKKEASNDLSGMRPNDPDLIPVGQFLRIWRIDELPQILNILIGDMSWVGPRPERPHIVARCVVDIPNYTRRHDVLPGITGLAQIHNPDATPNDNAEKLAFDLEYIEKANFWLDLKILWKTLVTIG